MSDSHDETSANRHPDNESLLAYADGRLGDVRKLESHLDRCAICANAVLILRGIDCLERAGIPPLSQKEKEEARRSLRGVDRDAPGLVRRPDKGGSFLAGLGGLLSLGFGQEEHKPILAGADPPHRPDADANPAKEDSGDSDDRDVTPGDEPPSSSSRKAGDGEGDDDLSGIQALIERALASDDAQVSQHRGPTDDGEAFDPSAFAHDQDDELDPGPSTSPPPVDWTIEPVDADDGSDDWSDADDDPLHP